MYSPFILMPNLFYSRSLKASCNAAVKSFGVMTSSCLTPRCIGITLVLCTLSLNRHTSVIVQALQHFDISVVNVAPLERLQPSFVRIEGFLIVHKRQAQWPIILLGLFLYGLWYYSLFGNQDAGSDQSCPSEDS
ncbi:unnamed protein product [Euphydryas editha]|uniref:Uncharacterized protein n=1 Tax=Euphydryas editha TaxID=104508 RepID=A0AAU9U743_EUPED|nr:unnamed protein product [Euphydryas editha]